jgi:cobalamin biosynthesis Mg chelatase CobN
MAKSSATQNASTSVAAVPKPIASRAVKSGKEEVKSQAAPDAKGRAGAVAAEPAVKAEDLAVPSFAFSGGIESSQSWVSANKYVLIVLLVIAAVVAALFFR